MPIRKKLGFSIQRLAEIIAKHVTTVSEVEFLYSSSSRKDTLFLKICRDLKVCASGALRMKMTRIWTQNAENVQDLVRQLLSQQKEQNILPPYTESSEVSSSAVISSKPSFRRVRKSKFRHVYGVSAKRENCYEDIKITTNTHDSQFCAVNPKFLAIVTEVTGGGAFLVLPLENTGRQNSFASRVTGHTGPVLDIKWSPFNENIIASCSFDCTVKLWHIPDDGLSRNLTECIVELQRHKKRVIYIEWHPVAENILFSVGFDRLVIIWDINRGEAVSVIDKHPDVISSLSLNRDGSLFATTCKDKKLRVFEPRSGNVVSEGVCHNGAKASKVVFLGDSERLLTTGFSRHSDRQFAVWSQHDLSNPLTCETINYSSSIIFPFYDNDTNMVYLAGKGDGNIRYYEVGNGAAWMHFLGEFASGHPQKGFGIMPKRGLDTAKCEIFRFYKLHATRSMCEPISMIVPRKSKHFQEDLYPDTVGISAALSAEEWISGINKSPILISLKTD